MSNVVTLDLHGYTAYIDPMTGSGLLVLPDPDSDVSPVGVRVPAPADLSGGTSEVILGKSLHAAGWNAAMRHLLATGWEPATDDDGGWLIEGQTAEGRTAIGLYGREPVISEPAIDQLVEAWATIASAAGLRRDGERPVA